MGQRAAQTVREIEQTRERLGQDIRELEERLPHPGRVAKGLLGVAAAGGAGLALWFTLRRRRARREAAAPVPTVVRVLPDGVGERLSRTLEEGTWKGWVAAAGGVWLAFRLAELRQLRRMNRILATKP